MTKLTARINANLARMPENNPFARTRLRKYAKHTGRFAFIGNQPIGRCIGTWRHYVFIRTMQAELAGYSNDGEWHNINTLSNLTFGGFTLAAI